MNKIGVINFSLSLFNDSIKYGIGQGEEMPKGADFLIVEKKLDFSKNINQVWSKHTSILMLDDDGLISNTFSYGLQSNRKECFDILFVSKENYLSLVETNVPLHNNFNKIIDALIDGNELDFIPNAMVFVIHYVDEHETYHEIDKWRLFFLSMTQMRKIQSALDKKKTEQNN